MLLDNPSIGTYSLGSDGTAFPSNAYVLGYPDGYTLFSPLSLSLGIKVDFLEFYYYISSSSSSFPIIVLNGLNNSRLFSISIASDGSLVRFHNDEWLPISAVPTIPTSGLDSWYSVRLNFNWETHTVDLYWSDVASNELVVYNTISMNSLTRDLCTGGSYFSCKSGAYFAGPGYVFDDIAYSRAWESAVQVGDPIYIGYSFDDSYVLKRIRIECWWLSMIQEPPYKFEIRADIKRPTSVSGYETNGDVLLSIDESDNLNYWSSTEWKEYNLDNSNNKEYSVLWLVVYGSDYYKQVALCQIEVLGLIRENDYYLKDVSFYFHDEVEDGPWGNGWDGTSSDFRIDNFLIQDTYYKQINNRDSSDVQFSITRYPMETDIKFNITVHNNINCGDTTIKSKAVVLSLMDGRSDWKRYVKFSFSNYVQEYIYFTGNKQAYKAVPAGFWEVRVEGYGLTDLPAGIDKGKSNGFFIKSCKTIGSPAKRLPVSTSTLLRSFTKLSCPKYVNTFPPNNSN